MGMYAGKAIPAGQPRVKGEFWSTLLMNLWVPVLMFLETLLSLAIAPLLLVLWLPATRWSVPKIVRHFIWIYGRIWLWIVSPFVRLKVKGTECQRSDRPYIYVANHLSFFDIFFLSAMPVFDVVICLRSWPFKLAWYTPFMRCAEYLDVERLPWEEIVPKMQRIFEEGRSILLFPQGHRSHDGQLGRFYSGAFKLAIQFNVPIAPICLSGTDRMLPRGRLWMSPADVRLECLEPIEPDRFQGEIGHIDLRKYVKELMGACLAGNRS